MKYVGENICYDVLFRFFRNGISISSFLLCTPFQILPVFGVFKFSVDMNSLQDWTGFAVFVAHVHWQNFACAYEAQSVLMRPREISIHSTYMAEKF